MPCPNPLQGPFRCPEFSDLLPQILALLPRGRAWQSRDGGPAPFYDAPFDSATFDSSTFDTESRPGSVLYRFWSAVTDVFAFLHRRACDLRMEFWCATHRETHAEWMAEYGLPDACDPFPDLCTKVAALGGTRCEYFSEIAARSGWRIACEDMTARCNGARATCARAGRARAGGLPRQLCQLRIVVFTSESPSFMAPRYRLPRAGRLRADHRLACAPNLSPLLCVLERVVPAHVSVVYQTTP